MKYYIYRKHLLSQQKIHGCLDSLQRVVTKNAQNGWRSVGGLTVLNDFVLLLVVNENDNAEWLEK